MPGVGYGATTFPAPSQSVQFSVLPSSPGSDNVISFTPGPSADITGAGQRMLLGTFTYTNGDYWASAIPKGVAGYYGDLLIGFQLTTHSDDPTLNGHIYTDVIQFVITRGLSGTPEQNADYFYAGSHPEFGSVRVFERQEGLNSGSIDYTGFISSLIPDGFSMFLYPSTDPIPDLAPIPEPSTLLLFATSAAGLGLTWRRRRQKLT